MLTEVAETCHAIGVSFHGAMPSVLLLLVLWGCTGEVEPGPKLPAPTVEAVDPSPEQDGLAAPVVADLGGTTTDRTPSITWNSAAGATKYELWINHEGVTNKVIYEDSLTGTSYTPVNHLAAGSYRIWVRAIRSNGVISGWSAAESVTLT